MGRNRKRVFFDKRYKHDLYKAREVDTPGEFIEFVNKSKGPVQAAMFERGLVYHDAQGRGVRISKQAIPREIEELRKTITDTRGYSREYITQLAGEYGAQRGLTTKQMMNAEERAYKARVDAIRIAARMSGVELSAADKRTLTQVENGFYRAVYGGKNQYAEGRLAKEARRARGGIRHADSSARARAQERIDLLNEYRGKKYGAVEKQRGLQKPAAATKKSSYNYADKVAEIKRQESELKQWQEARAKAQQQRRQVNRYMESARVMDVEF